MILRELKEAVVSELNKVPIDSGKVLSLIFEFEEGKKKIKSSPKIILLLACRVFGVETEKALSESRDRPLVYARAFYSEYMKSLQVYSLHEIGSQINRTHSSVINMLKNIKNLIETEQYFKMKWRIFIEMIEALSINDGKLVTKNK